MQRTISACKQLSNMPARHTKFLVYICLCFHVKMDTSIVGPKSDHVVMGKDN